MHKTGAPITHSVLSFQNAAQAGNEWIVLCDGKKVQIYEHKKQAPSQFSALFDGPISAAQLKHELEWHYPGACNICQDTLNENICALLTYGCYQGKYDTLTLVAPEHINAALKHRLPAAVRARILQSVEKDLTHCPKEAIASYFSSLH